MCMRKNWPLRGRRNDIGRRWHNQTLGTIRRGDKVNRVESLSEWVGSRKGIVLLQWKLLRDLIHTLIYLLNTVLCQLQLAFPRERIENRVTLSVGLTLE